MQAEKELQEQNTYMFRIQNKNKMKSPKKVLTKKEESNIRKSIVEFYGKVNKHFFKCFRD